MSDHEMTGQQFEARLRELKWSKNGLAHYLGLNERTVRRWPPVPPYAAAVLALMTKEKVAKYMADRAKAKEAERKKKRR
ncbi:MAG TPA: hypothetical protein VKT73_13045 [Xanthobacteraceae bacterium]|nr:hypothetical protein [Xanthobacteraceae bacterium]